MTYFSPIYILFLILMMFPIPLIQLNAQDLLAHHITSFRLIEKSFTYEPCDDKFSPARVTLSYLEPMDFDDLTVLAEMKDILGKQVFGKHYKAGDIAASRDGLL